jgi:uncharacterized surface anchored protein
MTQTLAYISGSLEISTEDINGNITYLREGVDYTVTYDGTGTAIGENGEPVHRLDIVILHPQPVTYFLDYETALIIPEQITGAIKYTNYATIKLWGEDVRDNTTEKIYADINIAAKNYKVEMIKTSAVTGEPLGGATFGLFNANGGLIATGVTNSNGELFFQTNIIKGIILREHILYYMQELDAPPGYQLDDTKHWFCFCDSTEGSCDVFENVVEGTNAIRIPYQELGIVRAGNHPLYYDLPETGGTGVYPLVLASVTFIVIPSVYIILQRRKRGRRGNR